MRCHSERSLRSEESENTSKTIGFADVYRFFLPKVVRMTKNDLNLMRNSILALRSNESNSRMRFALFFAIVQQPVCDRTNGKPVVTVAVVVPGVPDVVPDVTAGAIEVVRGDAVALI